MSIISPIRPGANRWTTVANKRLPANISLPFSATCPSSKLNLDIGIFAGLPVGDTQRFHTVQPILSAEYEFIPEVFLSPARINATTHSSMRSLMTRVFSRPVEQGFQLLVDREHYQQDLFMDWNQIETFQKAEQFDVGYAGRVSAGLFSLTARSIGSTPAGRSTPKFRTFLRTWSAARPVPLAIIF